MLNFIIKGIFRDRHRYLFPLIIVSVGVAILVFFLAFMQGYMDGFLRYNARFETGHVKIVTKAYAERISQKPYDLGLLDIGQDFAHWRQAYPQLDWVQRISFGALLDVPDQGGETRAQGEVAGFAIDIFNSPQERSRMNLDKTLKLGRMPSASGEIILSHAAFQKLELRLGDSITLIGATVHGSMSMMNFRVVGTADFGIVALDRGAVVADISDIRTMLDMICGAGEVLGFFKDGKYNRREVKKLTTDFNARFSGEDEFAATMLSLEEQNNLGYLIKIMDDALGSMSIVFIAILAIVLWNSGLMNGIRRWGEFGVRLAIGERKIDVYRSLVFEALILGVIGSLIGTLLGALISLYFQKHGFDMTAYGQNSSLMGENIVYTSITTANLVVGFLPGIVATVLGAALAGIAIFKRKTSQLFKELET